MGKNHIRLFVAGTVLIPALMFSGARYPTPTAYPAGFAAPRNLSPRLALSSLHVNFPDAVPLSPAESFRKLFAALPAEELFELEFVKPELGRLDTLAPSDIERSLGHVYTAGEHSRNVLRALDEIASFPESILRQTFDRVNASQQLWILRAAALFHDCGKGFAHDQYLTHPAKGANRIIFLLKDQNIRLPEDDLMLLRWLILFHDHMTLLATKRDPADEDTVIELMHYLERFTPAQAGTALRMLYLVSYADATGMNMRSPSRAYHANISALTTLFSHAEDYLSRNDIRTIGESNLLQARKSRYLQMLAPNSNDKTISKYFGLTPLFIIAPHRRTYMEREVELLENASDYPRLIAQQILGENFTPQIEIRVAAKHADHADFLAHLSALLYLHGLHLRHAQIRTTTDGIIFDRFVATPIQLMRPVNIDEMTRSLQHDIDAVFIHTTPLAALFTARKQTYAFPKTNRPFHAYEPQIYFRDDFEQKQTTLTVETTDRPGLLHIMSHALYLHGIGIRHVDMTAEGYRTTTVFQLDWRGEPLPGDLKTRIQQSIRQRLASEDGTHNEPHPEITAEKVSPPAHTNTITSAI